MSSKNSSIKNKSSLLSTLTKTMNATAQSPSSTTLIKRKFQQSILTELSKVVTICTISLLWCRTKPKKMQLELSTEKPPLSSVTSAKKVKEINPTVLNYSNKKIYCSTCSNTILFLNTEYFLILKKELFWPNSTFRLIQQSKRIATT